MLLDYAKVYTYALLALVSVPSHLSCTLPPLRVHITCAFVLMLAMLALFPAPVVARHAVLVALSRLFPSPTVALILLGTLLLVLFLLSVSSLEESMS